MTESVVEFRRGRSRAGERKFWVTVVLSIVIHALVLWGLPQIPVPILSTPDFGEGRGALVVQLAPPTLPPRPPSVAGGRAAPSAQLSTPAQPRPAPPVLALKEPAAAPPGTTVPSRPRAEGDLSSYIEARRRARGETAPAAPSSGASGPASAEDENARASRLAAANIAMQSPNPGQDPKRGGGIFQIEWMATDAAAFLFYGWDPEARRNTAQLIEVRRGEHPDIRTAVVRRMIGIIRQHEKGDFLWHSPRLERNVMLSARAADNAALEEFMMREFFSGRWRQ